MRKSTNARLRELRVADLAALERWWQPDQEWHRWDAPYFEKDDRAAVAHRIAALRQALSRPPEDPPTSFVIADSHRDELLGLAGWHWEHEPGGWARAGMSVYDPAVRGHGVGTAALSLLTEQVFTRTPAHRLDFVTWSGNVAMCRVGDKLGWTREACFRQARVFSGGRYDSVAYGLLRSEWRESQGTATLSSPTDR